jgi:sugar O-acyltransferase (sialic acid O-acetyltransferase NeuD family)
MGREAAAWVADAGHGPLLGFLDDDPSMHGVTVAGHRVLGGLGWLDAHPGVEVVIGVGSPQGRATVLQALAERGIQPATVIHPGAQIGPRVQIGPGCIICPGVVLTCDLTLGRAVIVNYGALLGHDCRVGDAAFIAPGAHVAGKVSIGERADIGIGASIIQGITIGAGAVVGAGGVVIRDVEPGTTVAGVPARPLESKRLSGARASGRGPGEASSTP